jgi:uncharacterized protein
MQRRGLVVATLALPALAFAQAGGAYRDITWEELVPPGWDPMKDIRAATSGILSDADPRAQEAMKKLREIWDHAPVVNANDGRRIRIPGYVVPLEETKAGLKEFLLVPYFGACIHTPPPPSNQIVHVLPAKPAAFRSMDTVWVSGTLKLARTDSAMGASSYRVEAVKVEPYVEPAAPSKP